MSRSALLLLSSPLQDLSESAAGSACIMNSSGTGGWFYLKSRRGVCRGPMINKRKLLTVIRAGEKARERKKEDAARLADALSISLSISPSLSIPFCFAPSLPRSLLLSVFFPLPQPHLPPCCAPLPLPSCLPSSSCLPPSPPSPLSFLSLTSHPQRLCSGYRISRLCTAGARTSVLLAASYVAH